MGKNLVFYISDSIDQDARRLSDYHRKGSIKVTGDINTNLDRREYEKFAGYLNAHGSKFIIDRKLPEFKSCNVFTTGLYSYRNVDDFNIEIKINFNRPSKTIDADEWKKLMQKLTAFLDSKIHWFSARTKSRLGIMDLIKAAVTTSSTISSNGVTSGIALSDYQTSLKTLKEHTFEKSLEEAKRKFEAYKLSTKDHSAVIDLVEKQLEAKVKADVITEIGNWENE
jgi:hypothetical protein